MSENHSKIYTYKVTLYCPKCIKDGELREYFHPFYICKKCLGIFGIQEVYKENEKIEEVK